MNGRNVSWRIARNKILSRADVAKILAAAKAESMRDYIFFAIAANTGFRLCEVVHLNVSDVGLDRLDVTRRKHKKLYQETIDIRKSLGELIKKYVNGSTQKSNWLFPGHSGSCMRGKEELCDGCHVSRRDIQRKWEYYLGKAKMSARGRGIHSLRHYAITEFYATHKDLRAAQLFAGHSSSTITEVYSHVLDMREKVQAVKDTL